MNYENMTVQELRKACAERGIGTGVWRAGASKAQLIAALEGAAVPEEPKPEPANGHGRATGPQTGPQDVLADALAALLQGRIKAEVDVQSLRQELDARIAELEAKLAAMPPREVIVKSDFGEHKVEGHRHAVFETVLTAVAAGLPVMLVGPAGTGKSHLASQVAKALGLPFYSQSVCAQTTRSELVGFIDAGGVYRPSLFRKAFEHGGLFLFDEIDAGNPNVLAVLNASLANGHMGFPDGMVPKHEHFRVIAAANTWGRGADRQYVGRQQLDAATLDRYVTIYMDYDRDLERALCPNESWLQRCWDVRARAQERGVRHIVSVRAIVAGARLLAAGLPQEQVEDMVLRKGLPEDQWRQIA